MIANNLVGAGVDPAAVHAGELALLVEARDRIPRQVFDEAISKAGDPGFAAAPYLAQEAVSDASELEPVIDAIIAANPGQVDGVPERQGRAARLLRRPGDEGDGRHGEPAGRQRARARRADELTSKGR